LLANRRTQIASTSLTAPSPVTSPKLETDGVVPVIVVASTILTDPATRPPTRTVAPVRNPPPVTVIGCPPSDDALVAEKVRTVTVEPGKTVDVAVGDVVPNGVEEAVGLAVAEKAGLGVMVDVEVAEAVELGVAEKAGLGVMVDVEVAEAVKLGVAE